MAHEPADSRRGPGADFLHLDPGRAAPGALTAWLAGELRAAVADGRLDGGAPVPPSRVLAADLGVSRGVVVEAYRRLGDEGLLTATVGRGTVVVAPPGPRPPATAPPARRDASGPSDAVGAPAGTGEPTGPVGPPLPLPPERRPPGIDIDLSPGVPDLAAFPRAAWLRAERAVLAAATVEDLGYGDPRGNPRLRHELAAWLARTRGVRAAPDGIVVVAGVAQSFALLSQTLRARGTTRIGVEDPGSRGARDELAHWGLEAVGVPVDGDGVVVADLAGSGVGAALLTPAHQFPTGVVLAPARRREVLDWAGAAGSLVVEDDYDAEHRYDRVPVPALQGAAPALVAHTGSTSKSLAPGMRLGWLVPPPHLLRDLAAAKHASDLGSPALPQLVLARLLATGEYDRHLRTVRARQRRRRDAVVAAVREHLPGTEVSGVAAGLHVLLVLPQSPVDDTRLAERAWSAGVLVHPLSWHRHRPGPPGLVLGYAAHPPDRLHEAVRRLGRALPTGAGT